MEEEIIQFLMLLTWSSGDSVAVGEGDRRGSLFRYSQQVAIRPIRDTARAVE